MGVSSSAPPRASGSFSQGRWVTPSTSSWGLDPSRGPLGRRHEAAAGPPPLRTRLPVIVLPHRELPGGWSLPYSTHAGQLFFGQGCCGWNAEAL